MASPQLHGRRVDLGAGYFTAKDDGFVAVAEGWRAAGLARRWTDTFEVVGGEPTTGPTRWATPGGMRSLVRAVLDGIEVQEGIEVETLPDGPVVVAMPDPQATRFAPVPDPVGYDPVIAVACGWAERSWALRHAAFVNDHPDLTFVADDGDRRGDGAAVLVAHTTAARAARHLADPTGAVTPVVAALRDALGVPAPEWTHAHRWTFAKPAAQHEEPFGLSTVDGRPVGFAGDQWCPDGAPRVESAWLSGTALAARLVAELG